MSDKDWSSWASIPWTGITGSDSDPNAIIGWHKKGVPYIPDNNHHHVALQTLEVWIPATGSDTPEPTDLPKRPGNWIIFIHGGAWRDPAVDSSCFSATASNILRKLASDSSSNAPIAGLASINYRLSPYPNHPTNPSPPSDPNTTPDQSRLAKHPDHIHDVLTGIAFLQRLGGAKDPYILAGHSCGATLAFQAVMNPSRWGLGLNNLALQITKPSILLGINGLYDLHGFIQNPPTRYKNLRNAYEEFTRAAFGDDEATWRSACPATTATPWPQEWNEGGKKRVILIQSREDSLVPYNQLEDMRDYLKANSPSPSLEIEELEADGDHDQIWEKGDRLAELCFEAVSRLGS